MKGGFPIPDTPFPIPIPDPLSPIPGKDHERPNNLNLVLGFYPPTEEEQTGETSDLNVVSMSIGKDAVNHYGGGRDV